MINQLSIVSQRIRNFSLPYNINPKVTAYYQQRTIRLFGKACSVTYECSKIGQ